MARRPILEKWRASRGHLSPQKPKLPWSYPVLAHLSVGYPRLEGRLPTCYSPVRRCTQGVAPLFSLDLHVLGTPPAFVLSQDQTLQLRAGAPTSTKGELACHVELQSTHPTWPARRVALSVRSRLGTFSARKLLAKGALLFSFQRPGGSAGRPRLIRPGLRIVKTAKELSQRPPSGGGRLDQPDLGETAAS